MKQLLTIVMYHYVRDLLNSRYPEIKGLSVDEFENQIQFIKKHYNVISGEQLIAYLDEQKPLPERPLLLTFDDGYIDHYTHVFPILDREGLPGCFFPPAKCIQEHEVLDVNKIHFVLASVADKSILVEYIKRRIDENAESLGIPDSETYWQQLGHPDRFDTAEVIFCKRTLQRDLPLAFRTQIVNELFKQFVAADESVFSRELYMNVEQIQTMRRHGMYIGSHGYDHFWLNTLSEEKQKEEVDLSLRFLDLVGSDTNRWIMCYPYGGYNDSLINVLESRGCAVGLTTDVDIAMLTYQARFVLPRIDTNDLPKNADAEPNEWVYKVMQ